MKRRHVFYVAVYIQRKRKEKKPTGKRNKKVPSLITFDHNRQQDQIFFHETKLTRCKIVSGEFRRWCEGVVGFLCRVVKLHFYSLFIVESVCKSTVQLEVKTFFQIKSCQHCFIRTCFIIYCFIFYMPYNLFFILYFYIIFNTLYYILCYVLYNLPHILAIILYFIFILHLFYIYSHIF